MVNLELWKKRKKDMKLTFDELSHYSGIPKRTILGIFREEVKTPRIDTVQAIERALGISSDITDEEYSAGVRMYVRALITADEDDLLDLYRELGEKRGQKAQQIIQELIKNMINMSEES